MKINSNEKLEKAIDKVLRLREGKKSELEILNLLPECKKELTEIFKIINILSREKEKIAPSKEALAKIISAIPDNNVTNEKILRYSYRGAINGRPSVFQLLNFIDLLNMSKTYIGTGIAVLVLIVIGGIYWQSQKAPTSQPMESITSVIGEDTLNQDLAELEELIQETTLSDLDRDLSEIDEEEITAEAETPATKINKKVDVTSIENLESELALELSGFSNDLSDLEGGFVNDTSLDNLDSGLSGVTE